MFYSSSTKAIHQGASSTVGTLLSKLNLLYRGSLGAVGIISVLRVLCFLYIGNKTIGNITVTTGPVNCPKRRFI